MRAAMTGKQRCRWALVLSATCLAGVVSAPAGRADSESDIYVVDVDGSDLTKLTSNPGTDYQPAWSPRGDRIAFVTFPAQGGVIYAMAPDGSGQSRLWGETDPPTSDYHPAWSADGSWIVFEGTIFGPDNTSNSEVFVWDGTGVARLTDTPGQEIDPGFSPDGRQVVFSSDRADDDYEIWVMDLQTNEATRLTTSPGDDSQPVWSPDGTRIAFTSSRNGAEGIWIMQADGTATTPLIKGRDPAWSPDGSRIAYTAEDGIHIVNADGTADTVVPNAAGTDPAWSPDGQRIAFEK